MIKLTDKEFDEMYRFVKSNYGINLENKRQLIESRMNSVLTDRGFTNYGDYLKTVYSNPNEITIMLNKVTTNHTYFLRESEHYDFLTHTILPQIKQNNASTKEMRIWSAGCSTGEEAYTTIMFLKDFFKMEPWDYRILATDLSTRVMESAKVGLYTSESINNLPPNWKKKYFTKTPDDLYALSDEIKKEVIFRQINLMDKFSFKKPFDLVFCRNVMIYFDQDTKDRLVNKYYDVLKPGGYLFIGHSETMSRTTRFEYIKPSIYRKGK